MTSLYGNIGGAQKSIASAFCNKGGSRKQIYPFKHAWQVFEVIGWTLTEKCHTSKHLGSMNDGDMYLQIASDYIFYENKSSYPNYNARLSVGDTNRQVLNENDIGEGYELSGPAFFVFSSHTSSINSEIYFVQENQTVTITSIQGTFSGEHCDLNYTTLSESEYIKGEYIRTIYEANATAYPDNGISGNYWYVYMGIHD